MYLTKGKRKMKKGIFKVSKESKEKLEKEKLKKRQKREDLKKSLLEKRLEIAKSKYS